MKCIELQHMLPKVFAGEDIPRSDIWLCECRFNRGERYLIEAPSGAGKSSLMAFIYGARTDYEGKLLFDGGDTSTLSISAWLELRCCHIAYLPQELDLFPELTCIENIRLKSTLTGDVEPARIDGWLARLGIDFRRDFPAGKMSIGQQQRLAIIRALCMPFDFLLLDEPVSHLDETNNRIAAAIIAEEAARRGAAVISTSVGNPLLLPDARHLKL